MKYSGHLDSRTEGNPEWVGNSMKKNKKYEDLLFGPSSSSADHQNSATYNLKILHDMLPNKEIKNDHSTKNKPDMQSPFLTSIPVNVSQKLKDNTRKSSASRPSSAKQPFKRYKSKHEPSFVDETLFGSRSDALQCSSMIPPDMICKGMQVSSRPSSPMDSRPSSRMDARPSSRMDARPSSRMDARPSSRMDSRPASRLSTNSRPATPKARHQASYVDDTLFGPKLVEADWAAPWDKEKPKKPLLFGSSDVKVTINHNIQICKERPRKDLRSAGAGVSRPPSSTGARPVWK